MTIPCTVVVVPPGTVAVSLPGLPLADMKIVPAKWGIKQIAKVQGSAAQDSFRVSCVNGSSVSSKKYNFTLTLYSDKECTAQVNSVKGACDNNDVVSFPAMSDTVGNFYYSVDVSNAYGTSQTLIADSYIVKKAA